MSKTDWIWLTGAIIWLGFGLYLAWLGLRQQRLERRLDQLLRLLPENGQADPFEDGTAADQKNSRPQNSPPGDIQ